MPQPPNDYTTDDGYAPSAWQHEAELEGVNITCIQIAQEYAAKHYKNIREGNVRGELRAIRVHVWHLTQS